MAFDIAVLGAGAAGLTAAYFAAMDGAKIILLEKNDECGKKILMSGGTRCNLLPFLVSPNDFYTESGERQLKHILKSWSLNACKKWFTQDIGLELTAEEASKKWFPSSNSSREVRDKLVQACEKVGVIIKTAFHISEIKEDDGIWNIRSKKKDAITSKKIILAMGGKSIPSSGTCGEGWDWLRKNDLSLVEPYPALAPVIGKHPGSESLAGLSLPVRSCVADQKGKAWVRGKREGFLFTHRGFSGPATLDLSHYLTKHKKAHLTVNWLGKEAEKRFLEQCEQGKSKGFPLLKRFVPRRLAEALWKEINCPDTKIAEWPKEYKSRFQQAVLTYKLETEGDQGYKKAEVTGGGLMLDQVQTKSLELKSMPGVYVCGELLDVFGRIGGFNFYWAWVTGRLAGKSSAKLS